MIFGKDNNKGLILDGLKLRIVQLGENGVSEKDFLVHDAHESNPGIQYMLANMGYPEYPVALGVIRSVEGSTYETEIADQIRSVQNTARIKTVNDLFKSGSTWKVE